jgi:hypothetical protein
MELRADELGDTLVQTSVAEYGIDLTRHPETLAAAATVGLVIHVWRNTDLERIQVSGIPDRAARNARTEAAIAEHGWAPADQCGIPDADMLRINVDAYRHVRRHVTAERIDLTAVHRTLTDPARRIRLGDVEVPAAVFFGHQFAPLAADIDAKCGEIDDLDATLGPALLCLRLAVFGMTYGSGWFGNPWWPDGVARLAAAAGRPAGSFQAELSPPPPGDLHQLTDTLTAAPNRLTHTQAHWALTCWLDQHVSDARRDWIAAHGAPAG